MGYTPRMDEAGRYEEKAAKEIVTRAQMGRRPGDPPPELMVRLEDALITLKW